MQTNPPAPGPRRQPAPRQPTPRPQGSEAKTLPRADTEPTQPPRAPAERPSADPGLTAAFVPGSVPPSALLPEQLPAALGRYRLLKLLGKGGMGAVYLAHDSQFERLVALKIPSFEAADGPTVLERFYQEARAAATVLHPNICPVHDIGECNGTPYLTMTFVEGKPLAEFAVAKPLTERQSALLVRKLALALQEAHKRGIIHRDLKPANVMIDRRGEPIIMDFGLARRLRGSDPRLTQLGSVMGTPAYMSPEQVSGDREATGPASDIYSLGVIFYELLTGHLPFSGDTMALLSHVLVDEPPPPSKVRAGLDPELEAICLKAMAKKPSQRYRSMADLVSALTERLKGPHPAAVTETLPVLAHAEPPAPAAAAPPAPVAPPRRRRRRRRRRVTVALALLLPVLLILGAVVYFCSSGGRTVTVQTDDPDIELVVRDGKSIVLLRDKKMGKDWELEADKYTLGMVDDPDGLKLALSDNVTYVLSRTDKGGVKIRRVIAPKETAGYTLNRKDIPEEALAWPGGGDPSQAPPELVAMLGDGRFRTFGTVCFPAYSSDATLLAVPADNAVFVFDARTGAFKRRLLGHGARVICVAFSPDGSQLASGGFDRTMRLWDTTTWEQTHELGGQPDCVFHLAYRPDNRALAVSSVWDGTIRLWNPRNGQPLGDGIKAHVGEPRPLVFRPDSKFLVSATAGPKGSVRTWDTSADRLRPLETTSLVSEDGDYARATFSPDGKVLAVGNSKAVRLLNPDTLAEVGSLSANASGLLAFVADGSELLTAQQRHPSATAPHVVERWKIATGQKVATHRLGSQGIDPHIAVSPNGKSLAVAVDSQSVVRIYDAATLEPLVPDPGHTHSLYALAFSPDGKLLASSDQDSTVRLWDVARGKTIRLLTDHTANGRGLAFSPDGKLLAASSVEGTVRLWEVPSGRSVGTLTGSKGDAGKVAFSPDGKFVAATWPDRTVRVWEVASHKQVWELGGFGKFGRAVAFSPNGKLLAGGSGDPPGTVKVWDLESGRVRRSLESPSGALALAFLPDNDTLVVAGQDGIIRRWSVGTGDAQPSLEGPPFEVYELAVRPGGRFLAAAGAEGAVRLWDLGSSPPRRKTFRHFPADYWVTGLAFSPDGRYLAAGNPDGTIYLFRVPEELPEQEPGQVRPVEKGRPAPDLSRAKQLYLDTFRNSNSGWGQEKSPNVDRGYADGRYFFDFKREFAFFIYGRGGYEEFAIELSGRVAGPPTGMWALDLSIPKSRAGISVGLNGAGEWQMMAPGWDLERNRSAYVGPVAHRAIKKGKEFNKLLVVVRGRQVEVYINGEAVCEPVTLARDITPAQLALRVHARSGGTRVELERLTIWSAADLPRIAPQSGNR